MTAPEPTEFPDGRYGLRARAQDATCQWFASGCTEVTLPRTDEVEILVSATDEVYACGDRTCTEGTCDDAPAPVSVVALGLGEGESCSLSMDGALWCWGSNEESQLSVTGAPDVLTPTRVQGAEHFASVDLGFQNTCALNTEGTLFCTGRNDSGAAGVGDRLPRRRFTPAATDVRFSQVSTGYGHTCAIADDASLYCWGRCCGQLGLGERTEDALTPTRISGGWAQVSAGGYDRGGPGNMGGHTCAIRLDGSLWCWGANNQGQLGLGHQEDRDEPMEVSSPAGPWAQVHAGGDFTCALPYDATLWCWGYASNGALGVGSISGGAQTMPLPHADGDWRTLAAAARGVCAIKRDNTMWCWGLNRAQELGQPEMQDLAGSLDPLPTHTDHDWYDVFAGQRHLCGIDVAGDVFCWGANDNGELGRGAASESSPFAMPVAYPDR